MSDGSPTEHFEHAEHATHALHLGDPFVTRVSLSIALLAVAAATVGSLETLETSKVTIAKNQAILLQNKATDNWNFFQAKSLKKNLYQIAAANGGPKAAEFAAEAARYQGEEKAIETEAKKYEKQADESLEVSDIHEGRHHILTIAVTLLHISIAVATIAIITRGMRWPWIASIVLGVLGVATAVSAYII